MRRKIIIALSILLAFVLVAAVLYANTHPKGYTVMPTKVLNVLNTAPAEYQIDADNLIITLQENPTTGYSWKFKIDKDGILNPESDAYKSNDTSGTLAGAGGEHVWVFKGLSKGEVVITFSYFRPWEDLNTATETKTFTVNVGENGKIESCK